MKIKFPLAILALASILSFSCKKTETNPEPVDTLNYSNFKITSVKVTAMPFTDNAGNNWDDADGPDVFFNIKALNGNVSYYGVALRINNVTAVPFTFTLTDAYKITNIYATQFITLYDYDFISEPYQNISNDISFTISEHKKGYPTSIVVSDGKSTVTLTGEWY